MKKSWSDPNVVSDRHMRKQCGLLKDVADLTAQFVRRGAGRIDSSDVHNSRCWLDQPVKHLEGRRFS